MDDNPAPIIDNYKEPGKPENLIRSPLQCHNWRAFDNHWGDVHRGKQDCTRSPLAVPLSLSIHGWWCSEARVQPPSYRGTALLEHKLAARRSLATIIACIVWGQFYTLCMQPGGADRSNVTFTSVNPDDSSDHKSSAIKQVSPNSSNIALSRILVFGVFWRAGNIFLIESNVSCTKIDIVQLVAWMGQGGAELGSLSSAG